MTRWLPYPCSSGFILALWLLLNQSVEPAHLLLGGALAVGAPLVLTALEAPRPRLRRPEAILRLAGRVLYDIVRSNVAVGRIVLLPPHRNRSAGFVDIPLTLKDRSGLAVLACIITATPGTSWVSYDSARGMLTIHVLDLIDDEEWRSIVKHRYERLLLEIFE